MTATFGGVGCFDGAFRFRGLGSYRRSLYASLRRHGATQPNDPHREHGDDEPLRLPSSEAFKAAGRSSIQRRRFIDHVSHRIYAQQDRHQAVGRHRNIAPLWASWHQQDRRGRGSLLMSRPTTPAPPAAVIATLHSANITTSATQSTPPSGNPAIGSTIGNRGTAQRPRSHHRGSCRAPPPCASRADGAACADPAWRSSIRLIVEGRSRRSPTNTPRRTPSSQLVHAET